MRFFCRKIMVNKPDLLAEKGPLLIASNHPNSFLDAILLDILFDQPIWSLTRGDVFKTKFISRLLTSLKMLPVYRLSEGAENLQSNYDTFAACKGMFKQNGVVLIFSEGKCINEWHLRALKKGTARLAISSWEQNIPLNILPVGINYSSFSRYGKNVFIQMGDIITSNDIDLSLSEGNKIRLFNQKLNDQLHQLVWEIDPNDIAKQKQLLEIPIAPWKKWLLAIPAIPGWLLHQPLYLPIRAFTMKKAAHNDHFDSILASLLLFTYPIYLTLVSLIVYYTTGSAYAWLIFLIMPLLAWSYLWFKPAVRTE